MKLLRIAAVILFACCLALSLWADYYYRSTRNTEGPEITCTEDYLELSVNAPRDELLRGLSAKDAQDGDLTNKILLASTSYFMEDGSFNASYVVFDSHRNAAFVERKVRFTDYEPPRFELSQPLVYTVGQNIRYLSHVTAYDVLDGDVTDQIKVLASAVSNYTPGAYPVRLEVMNSYGVTQQVELLVRVESERFNGPEIRLQEYLTYVEKGESFDPYTLISTVRDKNNNPISRSQVSVMGTVDTEKPGFYHLIFSCTQDEQEGRTYLTVAVTEQEG